MKQWIHKVIENENCTVENLNIILCSDNYLLELNKKYLQRDTLTDVIAFDYSETDSISGDIFISIDRVGENAEKYAPDFENELHRVIIHGVLHLLGYDDQNETDKQKMTQKENESLEMLEKM